MIKKTIASIFCIYVLIISVVHVQAEYEVLDLNKNLKIIDKIDGFVNENETLAKYAIATIGPVSKKYSEVKLLSGPTLKVTLIKRNLNRRLLRSSIVLPVLLIRIEGLSFTLTYKQDQKNNSKFSYATLFGEAIYNEEGNYVDMTNETYVYNKINKVSVENFTGYFIFFRIRGFRLAPLTSSHRFMYPAQFIFTGFCDNVTEIPI